MAGGQRKRSRTGKNVASSSVPSPPVHKYLDGSFLWFNDHAEATRFSEKFEHREILPPRFSTARFIHDSIPREARIILERGNFLDLLYIKKINYQPFLVRAFYSNLKKDEDGVLISNVNGVNIYLNEENIQILTGLHRDGQDLGLYVGEEGARFNETALLEEVGLGEGQSTTRPPLFDRTNYTYWKERMRIYIQSTNFLRWRIIKNGENVSMKKVEETNVPKTEDEYDAQDIKKVENNAKAINIIYCAVNPDDYRKISCCTTAKEILTPEWRSKADAIQESIGITNVTIDGLRESSDEDNEFGLVIKKFHKFMRKEYERKGKKHGGPPKCYGCGEVGHIKPKCPNAKNEKEKKPFKKHRAYISWGGDSGDESSEGEENESANLCLMAHEEPSGE
ncbi:unnamed protein product, partial [Cuscuta campestris]